jgi:hypothetical protein
MTKAIIIVTDDSFAISIVSSKALGHDHEDQRPIRLVMPWMFGAATLVCCCWM